LDQADAILATVRRLYDTVLEPGGWEQALHAVIAVAGGDKGILLGQDLRSRSAEFVVGLGIPSEVAATFAPAHDAGMVDEWLKRIRPETAVPASAIVPNDIFARSTFYNETVRPTGVFHAALTASHVAPHRRVVLSIGRVLGREDYDAENIEALQHLAPHLTTALRLRHEFGEANLLVRDARAALDRIDVGVILVDAGARPRFVNRRAHTIAAKADGLSLNSQGIAAARADQTRLLHRAIAAMATVASRLSPSDTVDTLVGSAATAAATRLRLSRPSLKPPLTTLVMPLCGARYKDAWGPESSVAVLVSEPDSPPRIDARALAESYGLAPRETQVAMLLAQGLNPREIASALGIGLGTAREHLKRALAKTNARRQANLVRLVLSEFTLPLL